MYVLERGMNAKWLGVIFAALTAVAAFGIGCMVQANSISAMVQETFAISPWWTGGVMTVLTAVVILGGIQKIATVCEKLVPFMAVFYVLGCTIILVMNAHAIGHVGAHRGQRMERACGRRRLRWRRGAGGDPVWSGPRVVFQRVRARQRADRRRGRQTKNPVRQALVSSTGTFWDTVVVCAMTGLVVVQSGEWEKGLQGAALTKAAFADLPVVGPLVLTIGLLTFVFSTILGWSYYGEKAAEYLFGPSVIVPYRWLWVAAVMVGSVASLPAVWTFADVANGLMAVPNLISLIALAGVAAAETDRFLWTGDIDSASEAPAPPLSSAAP